MARKTAPHPAPPLVEPLPGLPWYRRLRWQALLLFAFAFVLYGNTLGHDFAVDDAIVITDNSLVQRGVTGIPDLFAYDTFYGFFEDESKANLVAGGRYRPLTLAMFAVEQSVSPGPFIGHLFNVLWYGALLVLVLSFTTALLRGALPGRHPYVWWLSLLITGLFAAHPIHTEAVANIKGRDEIVALFFAVAAAYAVWKAARRKSFLGAAAGAGLMGLACLAKETAFTFLAVIPAVVLLFPQREEEGGVGPHQLPWSDLKYAAPAQAAALLYVVVRSSILPAAGDAPNLELLNNPFVTWTGKVWRETPGNVRVATGFATLLDYLRLIFVPTNLVHDYYPTSIPLRNWSSIWPYLGLLVHVGLGAFALLKFRTHRPLSLGILIYLAGISVASNVLFPVGTLLSERFLFFPSLGWAIAVGYGFSVLDRKIGPVVLYTAVAVIAFFSVATILRNPDWKDNYTLFTTDVLKQPDSAKLRNAAGGVRVDRYQNLPAAARPAQAALLTDAITDLDRAIEIHPTYRNAFLIRGNAKLLQENYDAAIADYDAALALDANYQPAADNLFLALTGAGRTAGEQRGDIEGAFRYLRRAEQLRPMDYETLRLLGVASGVSQQPEQAAGYFEKAVAVRPNDADAQWNYGIALQGVGRVEEARAAFAKAQQLRPEIVNERGN